MGFGTLFFGYFLILNVTYYGFTDAIAAAVMLLGFYKLSTVNSYFKYAAYVSGGFTLFGLAELCVNVVLLFSPTNALSSTTQILAMSRSLIVCLLTMLMLAGIKSISAEVELEKVPERAKYMMVLTPIIYGICILLEAEWIINSLPPIAAPILALIAIFGALTIALLNLILIHTCYARICMPEDEDNSRPKPSRFAFVNEYRRRKEEKEAAEEAERRRRLAEKNKKRKQRK